MRIKQKIKKLTNKKEEKRGQKGNEGQKKKKM